jgi:hypothetical protein
MADAGLHVVHLAIGAHAGVARAPCYSVAARPARESLSNQRQIVQHVV